MRRAAKNTPTFALLHEKRRLAVYASLTGARFTISLRDWEEIIWAVRVHPAPEWRPHVTPHTTAHRIMSRIGIEDWLAEAFRSFPAADEMRGRRGTADEEDPPVFVAEGRA